MQPGFLILDKAVGLRSTECVEKIKKNFGRGVKIGHGGTLDSTASGILVILLDGATRMSELVMSMPKRYVVTAALGSTTSTDDSDGEILTRGDTSSIDVASIDAALTGFLGVRQQVPPQVSAVHVDGVRAHKIARSGANATIAPRPVFMEKITRTSELIDDRVELIVDCSKGTYIRSLVRDLGEVLACGAHTAALRRTAVGPFGLDVALSATDAFGSVADELSARAIPIETLGEYFCGYDIDADEEKILRSGRPVFADGAKRTTGMLCRDDAIVVRGENLFSLCTAKAECGRITLAPYVNIDSGER